MAEGLESMDEGKIEKVLKDLTDAIIELGKPENKYLSEAHLAIKLTAFLSKEIMTRISFA